jgi:hypothetical protein
MSEYIGPIAVPDQTPSGTFPLTPDFGAVKTYAPEIVAHRFGHGDSAAEQRFMLGDGLIRWTLLFSRLSPARKATLQAFHDQQKAETIPFYMNLPMPDGSVHAVVARFDGPLAIQSLPGGVFFSASVKLCEVPQTTPSYTITETLTRFPDTTTLTALLSDTQELIPLVQIGSNVFLSDRRVEFDGVPLLISQPGLGKFLFIGAGTPPTGWTGSGFDDSAWSPAVLGSTFHFYFFENGAQYISDTPSNRSPGDQLLYRVALTCATPGVTLTLRCAADDWVQAVYFNGVLVYTGPGTQTGASLLIVTLGASTGNDTLAVEVYNTIYSLSLEFTVAGARLYQPRIVDRSEITQSIDGAADQFQVTLGNADRVFSQLARAITLYGATLQFSYYHVNTGTLLNLWSGEINDFQDDPTDKFIVSAGDPVWDLRKNYPVLTVDRNDPQFQVPDQPVNVHTGGNRITSTSIASDTIYGQPVQDVWIDDSTHPLKVPCPLLSGRDESQYYAALGIVSRGPIGDFYQGSDHWHTLDGQPWHGVGDSDISKRMFGLRRAWGGDPSTGNPASKDNAPDAGSNYFALDSTSTTWPQNGQPIDGVSFLQIRRTDASGIQPVAVETHDMEAFIDQGLGGWVWTAPGTRAWVRGLANPIWITINTHLLWKSSQLAGAAPCAALPSPLPSNWSSGAGAPTATPVAGNVYVDTTAGIQYAVPPAPAAAAWQAMGDYGVNLAKLYWYANAAAAEMEQWFDCAKAVADAAICDIAVTPLFARNVNVTIPNINGPPSSWPLTSNYTTGRGAPSGVPAGGYNTFYTDLNDNYFYVYTPGGWVLQGVYTTQDPSNPAYGQGGSLTISQAVVTEPQFCCAGVIGADASGNPRPLRDVLRDILGSCLGFFNFCFGKLRTGLAYNASATDAFTIGNTLYNSYSESSRRPGFTRLEVTFSDSDYNYADNSLGYEDKEVLAVAGRSVKKARVWGVTTKSQAARITATKAREEIGGHGPDAMMNARTHELRTTVLALSVEPGAVVSYTGPKTAEGTVKFRVTKWSLAKDFSLTIQGTTVVDEMYDLTSGPKPADVAPSAIPGRSLAGLRPLPVLPIIIGGTSYPFVVVVTTDGTSIYLSGEYCPPLPVQNFVGVTVYVEIPTGSGQMICAGDFDYSGNRNATDDQVWGVFCARMPLPATTTESWTVYLCSRTSALRAPLDTTAPHTVVLAGASGVFALPITSFAIPGIEIEGTLAQGGGTFTLNTDGTLARTGNSTHAVGDALAGAQSYVMTFSVGVPVDAATQGIYIVHAVFPDVTWGTPYPATGQGWYGDGWGTVVNAQPAHGAVYTRQTGWSQLLATISYQEFTARTYNFSLPPATTDPPSGMLQKVQFPAGYYQSQLFLVNGA